MAARWIGALSLLRLRLNGLVRMDTSVLGTELWLLEDGAIHSLPSG
jgi:hypothetical protein